MATKKKATSKKGRIRNLPKSKKKLTAKEAKNVKGGAIYMQYDGGSIS
jgi:hypothetical protein